jgi:hypothetical protein
MSEDPSSFLSNPPSTIVKVVNTSRDEINGQLGVALGFQGGRYMVHSAQTQQILSLKPENLVKASTVESFRAHYLMLTNDPRLKQKIKEYYEKAKRALHPVKPEYALLGLAVAWFGLAYFVGFTKTIMLTSVVFLLGFLVAPDVLQGASLRTTLSNVPGRTRQAMEETMPFLKGRLSNRVAMGVLMLMVAMSMQSLFVSGKRKPPVATTRPMVPPVGSNSKALQEEYYKLGFDDAKGGLEFGTSLQNMETTATATAARSLQEDDYLNMEFDDADMAPPPAKKRSFGIGSAMSAFYLFRLASDLGTDAGNGFSFERMVANARTLETWKLGMAAFSLYNLVRSII